MRRLSRSSASSGGACSRSPTSLSRSSSCRRISCSASGSSAISPAKTGAYAAGSRAPALDLPRLGFPASSRGASAAGREQAAFALAVPTPRRSTRGRGLAVERWWMRFLRSGISLLAPAPLSSPLSSARRDEVSVRTGGGWCARFWLGLGCAPRWPLGVGASEEVRFGRIGGRFMGQPQAAGGGLV